MKTAHANSAAPDVRAITSFFARSKYFQLKRGVLDRLRPPAQLSEAEIANFPYVVAESITPLLTDADPRERPLLLGKMENLRLACERLQGRLLATNEIFSFWKQVGPPWRSRGFVLGREVREGCVVPSIGGGLCQLSGSLLETAAIAGLEVVERHGHTALPDDIAYRPERDATVFWNYVDLRLRSNRPVLLETFVTDEELVVRLRSDAPWPVDAKLKVLDAMAAEPVRTLTASCYSCRQTQCLRHPDEDSSFTTNAAKDE